MKKIAIITLACLFPLFSFSQTALDSVTAIKRNIIGLDISTGAAALLGGNPYNPRVVLQYKRKMNFLNFRGSLFYGSKRGQFYPYNYNNISQINDSTLTLNSFSHDRMSLNTRIGIEKSFGKKNTTWFIGLDAIVGYYSYSPHFYKQFQPYYTDSISDNIIYDYSKDGGFESENHTYNYLETGVSLILGGEWKFSKRFGLGTQLNSDFILRHAINYKSYYYDGTTTTSTGGKLDSRYFMWEVPGLSLYLNFYF